MLILQQIDVMRLMGRLGIFLLTGSIVFGLACSKGNNGGGGTTPPAEQNLVVTTNPPNGSVQLPSLGPYNLTVTINSTMPSGGVKIEVSAKKDDGSNPPAFYSSTINSTTSTSSNFTITNTPAASLCLVTVKVTSLSKATNTWTGSYRYSSK